MKEKTLKYLLKKYENQLKKENDPEIKKEYQKTIGQLKELLQEEKQKQKNQQKKSPKN